MSVPLERDPRLIAGMRLFDTGKYHEAHEAWEELWFDEVGASRDLVKALIQISIAMYHRDNGNLAGAALLFRRAADEVLARLPKTLHGFDLEDLAWRARQLADEAKRQIGSDAPSFDRSLMLCFLERRKSAVRAARRAGEPLPPADDEAADA